MSPTVKKFIQSWLINTLAVLVATQLVHGIRYDTATGLLVATLLLGVLNAFLRPVLLFLSLPLLIFTLGLFTLVINALLLYFVGNLVRDFHVDSFWSAFWGALVISIVSLILNSFSGSGNSRISVRRSKSSSPKDGDGSGPVIDV
jgi:putative membrane protein